MGRDYSLSFCIVFLWIPKVKCHVRRSIFGYGDVQWFYPKNGSCIRMVSSRSGLVESNVTGAPMSSSIYLTYFMAAAGSWFQLRAPWVRSLQPFTVSYTGLIRA